MAKNVSRKVCSSIPNRLVTAVSEVLHVALLALLLLLRRWFNSGVTSPPSDDIKVIQVKHFINHVSELSSDNLHGYSQEFEVSTKVLFLPIHTV